MVYGLNLSELSVIKHIDENTDVQTGRQKVSSLFLRIAWVSVKVLEANSNDCPRSIITAPTSMGEASTDNTVWRRG